jgi:hypothetical protein
MHRAGLDLSGATLREPLGPTAEGLSGASFERVEIGGRPYVVKRLSRHTDWVMRAAHDLDVPYVAKLHRAGVFSELDAVDASLVEVAYDPESGLLELLMHDESAAFLRDSDPISPAQHQTVLHAMAGMHAQTWGWSDAWGLAPVGVRYQLLSPGFAEAEVRRGPLSGVPAAIGPLWAQLAAVAPEVHAVLAALAAQPAPLVAALATTPRSLVHGDWKGGNVGIRPDGSVVLVDWAFPGVDAPLGDLAWYLAVNCDRLPESKEQTVDRYRTALEGRGIETAGWWDRQLALALLGGAVQMAWNKAEQSEELAWWASWVEKGRALLP